MVLSNKTGETRRTLQCAETKPDNLFKGGLGEFGEHSKVADATRISKNPQRCSLPGAGRGHQECSHGLSLPVSHCVLQLRTRAESEAALPALDFHLAEFSYS